MKRYHFIVISVYIVTLVGCNITGATKLEHSRKKHSPGGHSGPGGVKCGPGDLVSRCKVDVDYNRLIRMVKLGENSPSFEFVPFDYDTSRSEAVRSCPGGTHFAVINDAVVLDNAAAKAFAIGGDINYWVDVSLDLDNVNNFLLQNTECTCFKDDFHIHTDESTFMEVRADRYKIKKKRSNDKKMMRGVICQKDEVTTTKPQPPTPSSKSTSSSGASRSPSSTIESQNPTVSTTNKMNVGLPTNPASTQKAFDWIIFLLCVIAITLIIGLFVGCAICWRIKSKKHQKQDDHAIVACAIKPYSKDSSIIPLAPPAYDSPESIPYPPGNPVRKSGIPGEIGVYSSYETPMENPHVSNFQQPAGIYNGSTGYADIGSPSENQNPGDLYDELQTVTSQAEYSYAYADRKSVVDQLNSTSNQPTN